MTQTWGEEALYACCALFDLQSITLYPQIPHWFYFVSSSFFFLCVTIIVPCLTDMSTISLWHKHYMNNVWFHLPLLWKMVLWYYYSVPLCQTLALWKLRIRNKAHTVEYSKDVFGCGDLGLKIEEDIFWCLFWFCKQAPEGLLSN